MSPEPSKKSPRSFQCRESLWQKFELMAQELECSVDYLINDAMKQYARQRGYGVTVSAVDASIAPPASTTGAAPPPAPPQPSHTGSGSAVSHGSQSGSAPLRAVQQAVPARPPAPPPVMAPAPPPPVAVPPAPAHAPVAVAPARAPTQPRPAAPPARLPPIPTVRSVPPPNRSAPTAPAAPAVSRGFPPTPTVSGSLAIYYKGEFFKINRDRFVIGRGKQSSDLTIKDPNVSRQHAMIEYLNGQYYIVDMGSTNGIEFEGQRIQRKAINDGDIFRVCDHELLFVFQ